MVIAVSGVSPMLLSVVIAKSLMSLTHVVMFLFLENVAKRRLALMLSVIVAVMMQ